MMRSSTPLKNAISATAVVITQLGEAISREERNVVDSVGRGSSLTGTMVNLFVDVEMAPPLIDTFILPEVPGVLYALFDYGLTNEVEYSVIKDCKIYSKDKGRHCQNVCLK